MIYSCRNRPHLFILNDNDTCVSCLFLSLKLSTARSNPSQSTSSHFKKNQSSWPNQNKVSEKKYEAITIMHIIHQINLQEHRGEHCTENQKERRSHLTSAYELIGLW